MGNRHDQYVRPGRKLILWAAGLVALIGTAAQSAPCSENTVSLRGDWGQARFSVEIADDAGERAQGLMFRESLPGSAGMLFLYDQPQILSFWMRNTLIPLDLLFIDDRGVVRHIHHNAIPHDETPITGGGRVVSVLEINGGLARRMGLNEGTQLRHPAFAGAGSAWPC